MNLALCAVPWINMSIYAVPQINLKCSSDEFAVWAVPRIKLAECAVPRIKVAVRAVSRIPGLLRGGGAKSGVVRYEASEKAFKKRMTCSMRDETSSLMTNTLWMENMKPFVDQVKALCLPRWMICYTIRIPAL